MTQLININFLAMTSKEIAGLCDKNINHVNRDIKVMLEQLDDHYPNLDSMYKTVTYKQKVGFGERDNVMYYLNKELTLTLVAGYNVKLRNAIVKRWQELELQQVPKVPQTYKEALLALVAAEEEKERLQLENLEQAKEIEHKQEVIIELVDNLDLVQKRQVLNKVVRKGGNYQERWRALYSHFENIYHCNVKMMSEKHGCSKLNYIDKILGKLDKLFEIACKLYETDVKQVKSELFPDML